MRRKKMIWFCSLVFVEFFFASSFLNSQRLHFIIPTTSYPVGDTATEQHLVQRVNRERIKNGLRPVFPDVQLQMAARKHALDMHRKNYFSHQAPDPQNKEPVDRVYRAGLTDFAVGENIALHSLAGDAEQCAEKFMDQWMNSPGHRANILKPEFNTVGIGVILYEDSTAADTVIKGQKQKILRMTRKHYAVQLFSDRDFVFHSLYLEQKKKSILHVRFQVASERDILIQIQPAILMQASADSSLFPRFTIFYPRRKGSIAYFDIKEIYSEPLGFRFLLADMPSSGTYRIMLEAGINPDYPEKFYSALKQSPLPIQKPKTEVKEQIVWFLHGEAEFVTGRVKPNGLVRVGDEVYYSFPVEQHRWIFSVPVFSALPEAMIYFGCGDGRQTQFNHRIYLNGKKLQSLKTVKFSDERQEKAIFLQE